MLYPYMFGLGSPIKDWEVRGSNIGWGRYNSLKLTFLRYISNYICKCLQHGWMNMLLCNQTRAIRTQKQIALARLI